MSGWNAAEAGLLTSSRSVRWFYVRCGIVFYMAWILCFEGVGLYATRLQGHNLASDIDRIIPFIPAFIWPYAYCYIFPMLIGFWATDWHRINRGFLSMILANLSAFVIFLAYPVRFPKPQLGDSLSERIIAVNRALDAPIGTNNLPSLHVAFAWIVYLMSLKQGTNGAVRSFFLGSAIVITTSTLFVKQHLLADAVAGMIWALGSWMAAGRLYRRYIDEDTDPAAAFFKMLRMAVPFMLIAVVMILFLGWLNR